MLPLQTIRESSSPDSLLGSTHSKRTSRLQPGEKYCRAIYHPHIVHRQVTKTGAVLIDLFAAYNTVWTGRLVFKVAEAIPCRKTLGLFAKMMGIRHYHVFLGEDKSKTRKIKIFPNAQYLHQHSLTSTSTKYPQLHQ